ncbi:hypothetical protein V3C99_010879 [Haemonchus contortus]
MLFPRLLITALLPLSVKSLSCYICGDNNLDEFGECSTQFQYDCQSYAARFPRSEAIFCRTTRHKAPNNTYTVMKECISERDHYELFPNKGYSMDEECDLVEVHGQEVAYCLCRHQNFCNKAPIADQFIAFEEKNPELFADVEPSSPSPPTIPKGLAPLGIPMRPAHGFGAPPVPPPPIIPVNDPRNKVPGIESEIRRAQLPTRERPGDTSFEGAIPMNENTNRIDAARSSVGQGKFIGSMGIKHHAVAVAATPPVLSRAPSSQSSSAEQSSPGSGMRCSQCAQSDLKSQDADCERQVAVKCHDPDAVCFTRQIILSEGKTAVEKLCASWQAVKEEFPTAALDGCGDASDGRVRFCTCTTNECNSMAISLQIAKDFPTDPLPPFVQTHPTGPLPHLAGPELPIIRNAPTVPAPAPPSKQSELPPQVILAVPSIKPIPKEEPTNSLSSPHTQRNRDQEELSPVPIEPVNHQGSGKVKPPTETDRAESNEVSSRIEPISSETGIPLRCAACLETGITDPTADCSSSAPTVCANHEKYCLTRQTQNEGVTFTMEKRCISESMVASVTKSESATIQLGCAIADGGMINYCLCKEDLCNEGSLLAQAQVSGIRKTEPSSKPEPPPPTAEELPKIDLPKQVETPPHVFLDNDETAKLETVQVPETKLSDEERDLIERQKQWDQEDLAASTSQLGLLGSLIVLLFGGPLF